MTSDRIIIKKKVKKNLASSPTDDVQFQKSGTLDTTLGENLNIVTGNIDHTLMSNDQIIFTNQNR